MWQKAGRPAIPLRPGETCVDLEKFLSCPITRDSDAEAINAWIKEAEMPTDKGKCKHGEFILTEGCPQCIEEARLAREAEVDKAEEMIARDTESLAMNQQGQLELAAIEEEIKISPRALPSQAYDEYFTPPEATESGKKKAPPLSKTQAHIRYKLANGEPVPGVTTVLNILNKPALVQWAWELGRQGLDWREVRDNAGDIGTLAHYLILCHLKGEIPDVEEYSPSDVGKANNCLAKFKNWLREHPISPVMIEEPLVSEEYRYGGTLDLFAEHNGEFILVDFKTGSSGIFPEMMYQLAAYQQMLKEQGWPVASARILRMSRDGDDFEEKIQSDLSKEFAIFKHCLNIYQLQRSA